MPAVPRRSKSSPGPGSTGTTDTAAPRRVPPPPNDGPPPPPGPAAAPKPRATGGGNRPQLQKSLEELFSAPALLYALKGDEWAEAHITEHAPRLAEAWYKLAQKNPAVRRMLENLTTGSAWGGVAVATGVTVLPLLAHHNALPGPLGNVFSGVPTTGGNSGPTVPPPPGASGPRVRPPAPQGPPRARGGTPPPGPMVPPPGGPMTAPTAPGAPAGVVTVAGSNNRAVMVGE